jgi:hypothetical protein
MRQPPFTLSKIPGTHFCYRLSQPPGHSAVGKILAIEKSNDLIGNQTCDLQACSIVPQPTTLLFFTSASGAILVSLFLITGKNTVIANRAYSSS